MPRYKCHGICMCLVAIKYYDVLEIALSFTPMDTNTHTHTFDRYLVVRESQRKANVKIIFLTAILP